MSLFCFPYAGGSATYYFPLSQALAPEWEVFAVQYPGRQERHREKVIDTVPDLADRVAEALTDRTDRPFAFFGHSMGAVVAFETARRLQVAGRKSPAWLFASGRRAPSRRRAATVSRLDDAGLLAELLHLGATSPRLLADPEIRAAIVSTVRADYRAIETYEAEPGASVSCPVTVLVGDSDQQTSYEEALAWRDHCTGRFAIKVFSGGHFYLDNCRREVVDTIRDSLVHERGMS
ncbi:thioesterase II family protein [Micromonospora sp. RP3T]|uniref:thioesterase II family protein n=1 Tax=Micromonospora sp. RP3T TaxID=2135446 RepID=UPI001E545363|nr:alpha/beta fold hydrolase [Micromonospora sp. RP3T]